MRYLYIDNFRGFTDSVVPILDVNFLVGENSTGKTSLLNMLRMLSHPQLYMEAAMVAGEEGLLLGSFNELVSVHSQDRSYFRLGLIDSHSSKEKKSKRRITGLLLTFRERAGRPKIVQMTCTIGPREICLSMDSGHIRYKNTEFNVELSENALVGQLRTWAEEHAQGDGPGWSELTQVPKDLKAEQFPLFFALAFAARRSEDKEDGFSLLFPETGPPPVWIAPIRSRPKRTYDEHEMPYSAEGAHTPYAIKRLLNSSEDAKRFKEFIERVGQASGLFQKIEIKSFGESAESPFEVDAFVDGKALSLAWLGYGVSQALPIFVELLARPKNSLFSIQQPEVHLHPRAQAALGDVLYEMAVRDKKRFLVETHSDFMIDRFRMNYRTAKKQRRNTVPTSQILFFERYEKHNVVSAIPIGARGDLPSDQPDGYRNFFIKEEMNLLGL